MSAADPSLYDFLEIDIERAPVAAAPEPTDDATSERFALLESDAIPSAPEPAPVADAPAPVAPAHVEPPVAIRAVDPSLPEGFRASLTAARERAARERAAGVKPDATPANAPGGWVPSDFASVAADMGAGARSLVSVPVAPVDTRISAREMIAGAAAEGMGALHGWTGAGSKSRGSVIAARSAAGLPSEWDPAPKSAHAHCGDAVSALRGRGYDVKSTPRSEVTDAGIKARYTVGSVDHAGAVGDAYGRIVLTVALTEADTLAISGDAHLAELVRADFAERCNAEIYKSSEITDWLRGVLRNRLGAVKLGGIWYVRREHTADAARLLTAIREIGFGVDWTPDGGIPVATSDQIRSGIAQGLASEASDVLHDLEIARKSARDAGRSEIGERAAGTLLGKLRTVAERAVAYATLLGETYLADVRGKVDAAITEIEPLLGDTSARGALIWEEIGTTAEAA